VGHLPERAIALIAAKENAETQKRRNAGTRGNWLWFGFRWLFLAFRLMPIFHNTFV
jgi:hypothetical protein